MNKDVLLKLLTALADDKTKPDAIAANVSERIVLKKYACDGPADRTDEPIETIVIENGVVIE